MKSLITQLCPTLCNPVDCGLPGSSVHGIFQARELEWVAISFSGGSFWSRDWTWVSCIWYRCFTTWATREAQSSKVTFKILQARLQQYMKWELADVQAGFRKGRGTRDQIVNISWIKEKARHFQKTSTSASSTKLKPLTVWITINWKILRDGNTRLPYLSPEKPVCRSRSNS